MKLKVLLQKEIEIDTDDFMVPARDMPPFSHCDEATGALARGERCFFINERTSDTKARDLVAGDHLCFVDPDNYGAYHGRIIKIESA